MIDGRTDGWGGLDLSLEYIHAYRQYWLAWSETENNWESHS
jgi:hypothetical protein